jgi:hypothetical protein
MNVLLTPHEEYLRLNKQELNRRKAYRELFRVHIATDIDDQIKSATNSTCTWQSKVSGPDSKDVGATSDERQSRAAEVAGE